MMLRRNLVHEEEGLTVVLVALAMVAILIMAGLVLDFGLIRSDRQSNKAAADFATKAGIQALDAAGDGVARPFHGVCEAYRYLKANRPEMDDLSGELKDGDGDTSYPTTGGDPCQPTTPGLMDQKCVANDEDSWAWFAGTADGGRIVVDIKNGYDLDDGGFGDEAYASGDDGDPAQGNCDHLAVIVRETQDTSFGVLAGWEALTTTVRSVGRVVIGHEGDAAVALLLLEREKCRALYQQGGGASASRVTARGFFDKPGFIHSDSDGTEPTTCVSGAEVLDAEQSDRGIFAQKAETPVGAEAPGSISIVALLGGPGAAWAYTPPPNVTAENSTPFGSDTIGRGPVDRRYHDHVSGLRGTASTVFSMDAAAAAAAGYTVYGCAPPNPVPVPTGPADPKIYIDCPDFTAAVGFDGPLDEVVFNGKLTRTGGALNLSNVRRVYLKGTTAPGEHAMNLEGSGQLLINLRGEADCTTRFTSHPRSETTLFVIESGPFAASGGAPVIRMCNTFVHLMDGTMYAKGAEPQVNTFAGWFSVSGGGPGNMKFDWKAANVTDDPACSSGLGAPCYDETDPLYHFEDLALWTETQAPPPPEDLDGCEPLIARSCVAGNGSIHMTGIFFLPNADPMRIAGNGFQDIDRDAQFVVRRLQVAGNAKLTLRPDPRNSILFPVFKDWKLVR